MATPFTPASMNAMLLTPTAYSRVVQVIASRPTATGLISEDISAYVSGGSVTCDARRSMRWSGSLTLSLPDGSPLMPTFPTDLLTPFGTQISIRVGVERIDGTTATVPLGVMDINSSTVTVSAGSREVSMEVVDVAQRIDLYRFEAPLTVPGGDLADTINAVIADRTGTNPGLAPSYQIVQERTFGLEAETGPWAELQSVVSSFGFRLYYDRQGALVMDSPPPPVGPATYTLVGPATATGTFDQRPANVAVARGEPPDGQPPVQGVAMDTNPNSPTWAGNTVGQSPYGRVTAFLASPLIVTQAQADQSAAALRERTSGLAAAWTVTRAFDPTIDPDDVVRIPLSGNQVDVLVDSITVNLAGETSLIGRQVS